MEEQTKIEEKIAALKEETVPYHTMEPYHVFTLLCLKYFFFSEDKNWGPEAALECLTDGSGDGGIDAILMTHSVKPMIW